MSPTRLRVSPYLLLALTQLFWAGNWVVGRAIRGEVPPLSLAFWRWVLALLLFLPLAWPHFRGTWPTLKKNAPTLLLLGAFGTGMYNALSYIGLTYTTVTNGVLLNSFCPILIIAIGWAFFGKRLRALEACGVLASLAGVVLIVSRGDLGVLAGLQLNIGDLWVLGSVTSWSLYTLLLSRRPAGLNNWVFLVALSVIGLVLMSPAYLWELSTGKHINHGPIAWAAMAYTGIFPAFLGYIFWNRGVVEVGAARAGLFMHLMPAFGIILSMIFLGERPALYHLFGIALIFGGIALTVTAKPAAIKTP